MREYGTIRTAFWTDDKAPSWSTEARLLTAYLITGPHTTGVGCFRLPDGYIASDLRWSAETVSETVSELLRAGFMERTGDGWTWVCRFLKHNPIANPNVGKSMMGVILAVPRHVPFYQRFIDSLETVSERFPEGFLERLRQGMPNQEQEQEQEQELVGFARSESSPSADASSHQPAGSVSPKPADFSQKKQGGARKSPLVDAAYLAEMKLLYVPEDVDVAWANMRRWLTTPAGQGKSASKKRFGTFLKDAEPLAEGAPPPAPVKKEEAPEGWEAAAQALWPGCNTSGGWDALPTDARRDVREFLKRKPTNTEKP
jgi:hypothetical protein